MINLLTEEILSLTEAAKKLPARRAGKRPHAATLYRWAKNGLGGFRLETVQVGGTKCTSMEALQRFFEQLGTLRTNPVPMTPAARERDIASADEELKQALS